MSRLMILVCVTAAIISGQETTFNAASVKVVDLKSHPVFANTGGPGTSDPGRIHLCCVGMFSLLMRAYDVEIDRIVGPDWVMDNMGPNLYEVDATMPADTTKEQYQLMMQQLLRDRFHLEIHRATRNFPGYELVIAPGGSKLKEATTPGPHMFTSLGSGEITVQAQQMPISALVNVMGRMINQSLGENPNDFTSPKARVLDRTGLTGTYDFSLRFSCELCRFAAVNGAMPPPPQPAGSPGAESGIFEAVQRQLGLKLNKVKDIPLDVIVVDHIEKTPTTN